MKKGMYQLFRILLLVLIWVLGMGLVKSNPVDLHIWMFPWFFIATGVTALLAAILQLIAHELGHLVGGAMTGYRFSSIRVGKLLLVKKSRGLRFYWIPGLARGGQCIMEPPQVPPEKLPVLWYNLGGVLANLLLTLVCWALYGLADFGAWGRIFCGMTSITGLYALMINGLPFVTPWNDGTNLLRMLRDPEHRSVFCNTMRMSCAMDRDILCRDMPEEWFWKGEELLSPEWYCRRLLDQGRFQDARQFTEQYLTPDTHPQRRCGMLMIRLLCHAILEGGGPELLELCTPELQAYLEKQKKGYGTLRTLYLLALLGRKNSQVAEFWLKRYRKFLKRESCRCNAELEENLITLLQQKATENT